MFHRTRILPFAFLPFVLFPQSGSNSLLQSYICIYLSHLEPVKTVNKTLRATRTNEGKVRIQGKNTSELNVIMVALKRGPRGLL